MRFAFLWIASSLMACGDDGGSKANDGSVSSLIDGTLSTWDGSSVGGGPCTASGPQCNNCLDDDNDGLIDGYDPQCTGPLDQIEDSFSTGIAGDNKDAVKQDCFFDGNSGDSCQMHVCCLLEECPDDLPGPPFDPEACVYSQECISECLPLTPPGCDCFGCCTVCNDDGCFDVLTNPATAPECTQDTLNDPAKCPTCNKFDDCSAGACNANPDDCVLCPGEDTADLPETCNGDNQCADGVTACAEASDDCGANQYCSSGCCRDVSID